MSTPSSARIAAIGELLWDLLPSGARLGGTTTNFAVMSARLGTPTILISRTGHDPFGANALALLADAVPGLLDLTYLQVSPTLPTGTVSVTLRPDGQPLYRIDGPVAWDEIGFPSSLAFLAQCVDLVCFGSLAQRNPISRATIRAFIEATLPTAIRVCDINLRMPFCDPDTARWCLHHATILKISEEELPELADMLEIPLTPSSPDEPDAAETDFARRLLTHAPTCLLVAITLGPRGSLLVSPAETHREPGRSVPVVDTVGAGDAFTAGMVYAYLRRGSLAQINAVGNLCGRFVVGQPGATPELPPSLLEQIKAVVDTTTAH